MGRPMGFSGNRASVADNARGSLMERGQQLVQQSSAPMCQRRFGLPAWDHEASGCDRGFGQDIAFDKMSGRRRASGAFHTLTNGKKR